MEFWQIRALKTESKIEIQGILRMVILFVDSRNSLC